MTLFFAAQRAAILVPSGPKADPDRKHLFILLTDPIGERRDVLMVGISSIYPNQYYDSTCCLYPEDHGFITRESFVRYAGARIEKEKALVNGVKQRVIIPKGTIASETFARICMGLTQSRHTKPKILAFFYAAHPPPY